MLQEIKKVKTAKLIGLIAHLAYWNVFGHFNSLPLDMYHMKQMFISIQTIRTEMDLANLNNPYYGTFQMPMLVLAIRIEVELIFKNSYPEFFSVDIHEKIAIKLINDLVTQLIDPNLFYSRFSFFESGRDAINIKYSKAKQQGTQRSQNRFFRRSALVEQLFPNPSEGKVRALFATGVQAINAKTTQIAGQAQQASMSRRALKTANSSRPPRPMAHNRIHDYNKEQASGQRALSGFNSNQRRNLQQTTSAGLLDTRPFQSETAQKGEEEDKVLQLVNKV